MLCPTNDHIRENYESVREDELPRDTEYKVMAARPTTPTEAITDPVEGYYHAMYLRDQIEEEFGYAGVTFHLEEV